MGDQDEAARAPSAARSSGRRDLIGRLLDDTPFALHEAHAPRLREDNQTIVRASPDILYSVCVYDVSDGPVVVEAPWPADGNYTSVSFYDARTNNFAVFSDRDGDASPVGIVLTGNADTAEVPAGFHAVSAPTSRGLILYRRVIDADTDMATAETERRGFTCARLSDE